MQSDLIKEIQKQKKIPIIGKGKASEIFDKVDTLITQEYKILRLL